MPLHPPKVVLINPYELGRQPFALAHPKALLEKAGFTVVCIDLSLQKLEARFLTEAMLVAVYLGMHTATRIAGAILPRLRELAPQAHLCVYGLYAPINQALFQNLGVKSVLGGEFEPDLMELAIALKTQPGFTKVSVNLSKIHFTQPDRSGLPALSRYAHLLSHDRAKIVTGFVEASRGCKHLCRHCPVVPVYQGKFRIIPMDVVLKDIAAQIEQGAGHISFGDPDFFNGPGHSMKIVRFMHERYPSITYDATIKIQHILQCAHLLAVLKETGCLFITSAVESIDDKVLQYFDKEHTAADFTRAVQLLRHHDVALAPTFVPFTPWTTLAGYIALLQRIYDLELIENVPAIQFAIRLLVPRGSYLLNLAGFDRLIGAYDAVSLGYTWQHTDPRVDELQQKVQHLAASATDDDRFEVFVEIWRLAHHALGVSAPPLLRRDSAFIPHLSEPWYCCAEPTDQQLQTF